MTHKELNELITFKRQVKYILTRECSDQDKLWLLEELIKYD